MDTVARLRCRGATKDDMGARGNFACPAPAPTRAAYAALHGTDSAPRIPTDASVPPGPAPDRSA